MRIHKSMIHATIIESF